MTSGRGVAAILVTTVAVALVGEASRGTAGRSRRVAPLSWPSLVGVATLAGVAASVGFTLLTRTTDRPERWFVLETVTVLVLSFVLGATHVAVAVSVTVTLLRPPGPSTEVETASSDG